MPPRFGDFGGAEHSPDWVKALNSRGLPPEPPRQMQRNLSIQTWDSVKPPTAQDFVSFTSAMLALPAVVNGEVSTTQATGGFIQLPDNSIACLQQVTFSIVAPVITDRFTLTVFENGAGIPGLTNVGFQPVVASYFAFPLTSIWQISKGARLDVTFKNLDGAAKQVGIFLSGYAVPEADVFQYTGQRKGQMNAADPDYSNLAR